MNDSLINKQNKQFKVQDNSFDLLNVKVVLFKFKKEFKSVRILKKKTLKDTSYALRFVNVMF